MKKPIQGKSSSGLWVGTICEVRMKEFSKNLKFYRKNAKLSQKQLADIVKTQTVVITRYELGNALPRIDMLKKLALALDVSADLLMGMPTTNNKKRHTKVISAINTLIEALDDIREELEGGNNDEQK